MASTLLFLCTGNYYRSRFAECLFRHRARTLELGWQTDSRGLGLQPAKNPGPISPFARAGLEARGIPYDDTRVPLALTEADLRAAARTIAVDGSEHRPMVERLFPAWLERIEFWDIEDIDRATPEDALPRLEARVEALLSGLAHERG